MIWHRALGSSAARLCLLCFHFQDKRRFRKVFPPLSLRELFAVVFGMQSLLMTEQRDRTALLSVVHHSLPIR
jgi:hypothetical protein